MGNLAGGRYVSRSLGFSANRVGSQTEDIASAERLANLFLIAATPRRARNFKLQAACACFTMRSISAGSNGFEMTPETAGLAGASRLR